MTKETAIPIAAGLGLLGVPVVDWLLGQRRLAARGNTWASAIPVIALALHLASVGWATYVASRLSLGYELVVLALSVGVCSGFGLNVAHTCCHGRGRALRLYGQAMNLLCAQLHTPYEHRLHHATYATRNDPASARLGEDVYRFAMRYVVGAIRVVWLAENRRLARASKLEWLRGHAGVRSLALPVLLVTVAWATHHSVFAFLVLHAAVAVFMTVLGNYVAHYGLVRVSSTTGKREPGSARHSWNDSHAASKFLLFGLSEHSHHHAHPSRPFWESESGVPAPELPLPYSWMILASLVPPLFRHCMDERASAWAKTSHSLGGSQTLPYAT